jgi:hypothetical protein
MTPSTAAIEAERIEKTIARSRWKTSLAITLVCALLTSIAVLPFFVIGEDQKVGCCGGEMPITHDAWMHYNQMNAFWQSLAAGIIYPRWDENTHGYGAPTTSFYPPGVYYLTSAVYFVARDWVKTWTGFYWLVMLASAAAIYWYARQQMARGPSLLAMAAYVFAPYHLINQYQRGAMSEFTSFVWVPLCLLFAERLLRARQTSVSSEDQSHSLKSVPLAFAGLAASFGAFLWTHPPTAYQFALVFGLCVTASAVRAGNWRGLGWIALALFFGSLLAAAYFYPAMVEQRLVNYDDVERAWPYHASYVFDFSQNFYDHVGNAFFVRLDRIWVFNLVAILIASAVLWRGRTAGRRRSEPRLQAEEAVGRNNPAEAGTAASCTLNAAAPRAVWQWAVAGLLASFLMTKYSAPLGRLIPKIEIGVFSWRMLTLTSFATAMLAGAVCSSAFRRQHSEARTPPPEGGTTNGWRLVISASILLATLAMSAWYVAWPMWRGQAFEPKPEHYNYATLPRGAPRDNPPMPPVQFASGNGSITVERWTPEFRQLHAQLAEPDQLQFRTRNFAGWTAIVDGQIRPIVEGSVKNIALDLPAGDHRITLEFRPTPIRRAGNWLTVISFVLLLSIVIKARSSTFRRTSVPANPTPVSGRK